MNFGSDQFFQRLKDGMLSGADETFYTGILEEIERDIRPFVASKITYPDGDDVIQQILLAVWISLAKFVETSSGLSTAQRNAWLLRIVNNKVADYFRIKYTNREDLILEEIQECSAPAKYDPGITLEIKEKRRTDEQRIDELLNYVCSLNMRPEKIIAFIYSKVIFSLNSEGSLKGSAKYAYDMLNGKRFFEVMSALQVDFDAALGRPLEKATYDTIYRKIGPENMNCSLKIELQEIANSTSYIIKRIRREE